MNWLSQNWLWVAFGIGAAYYLFRGRLGGLIGAGHGGAGRGGDHGDHESIPSRPVAANPPEAAVDPVTDEAVRTSRALTSLYQGNIYYFASRENRDRFESTPQDYARKAAGHPVATAPEHRPRRRHGC